MDTASKRGSSLQFLQPMILTLPLPDGDLAEEDRYHSARAYSGILAGAPVVPPPVVVSGGGWRPLRRPERSPQYVALILERGVARSAVAPPALVVWRAVEVAPAEATSTSRVMVVNVFVGGSASAVLQSVATLRRVEGINLGALERAMAERDELVLLGL